MKNNNLIKEEKLKLLRPTWRLKKRFVRVRIISDKKFDFKTISEEVVEQLIIYLGAVEFSKAGIWILRDKFDYENQEFVVKVSTKLKDKLVGVLGLILKINDAGVKLEVRRVSGTLKGVYKN